MSLANEVVAVASSCGLALAADHELGPVENYLSPDAVADADAEFDIGSALPHPHELALGS